MQDKRSTVAEDRRGLECRHCGCKHFRVVYTRPTWGGRIMRRRECRHCGKRMTTWEKPGGYREYVWRRLLTISAEDCWGVITHEVEALFRSWQFIDRKKKGAGRVFVAKATILLAEARKCRDADHLTNLVYDPATIDAAALEAELVEARAHPEPIPDYAYDCHTFKGKQAGKTKQQFFVEEHQALQPRQAGLFDQDIEEFGK